MKIGSRAADLRKIVSHPEVLNEGANWLKTHSPSLLREYKLNSRRGRSSFQRRWNHSGYRLVQSDACLSAAGITSKHPGRPTQRDELRRHSSRWTRLPGAKTNALDCPARVVVSISFSSSLGRNPVRYRQRIGLNKNHADERPFHGCASPSCLARAVISQSTTEFTNWSCCCLNRRDPCLNGQ